MIHSPLCDSSSTTATVTATKLIPHYTCCSTLSSYVNRSSISSYMGLKWSKRTSGNKSRQRFSTKVRQGESKTAYVHGRHARERVLEEEAPEMLETSLSLKVSPGQAYPLGVSEVENGINFAIFSQHATSVKLCLSLPEREEHDLLDGGMIEVTLDPRVNRTGDIWHISFEDIPRSSVLYGYRMDGPQAWHQGHRFDSNIVLIDPYAKFVEGRRIFGDVSNKLCKFFGTYDFNSLPFDWGENYKLPNIPEKDLVIYEMNVRAFTADKSSGLDPNIRGSYLGVIDKLRQKRLEETKEKGRCKNRRPIVPMY